MTENDKKLFVVRARMSETDRDKLQAITKEMEESMSTVIRMLIRRAYAEIVVPKLLAHPDV
jgi:antitoxin component of RelBE/YafQ-DinJ toxin-antitoxin module